ncbi:MAG TPA: protein translocase subunit SecD [Patescibacteria group bacterium]|nr:protein translocase subunit SecD [Patescibacteria group bacterium]
MATKSKPVQRITRSQVRWKFGAVVALFVLCVLIVFPAYVNRGITWVNAKTNIGVPQLPQKGFNLGLDLQGGAHLIYLAKTDQIPEADRKDAVEGVRDVIERRVRGGLGVAEPLVQTTRVGNEHRIIVELPGVTNVNEAIKMIGETPVLEFKEENNDPPRELTPQEQKDLTAFNAAANRKIRDALTALRRKTAFEEVVKKYSEDELTKEKGGDMGFITKETFPELHDWASTHKDGEVSKEAIKNINGLNIVKRIGERPGEKEVSAAHILVCYQGAPLCENPQYDKKQAKGKVEEIKKEATPANFADLVTKYSTEPGAAERAGELGFFKKGDMVPEFEQAVWDVATGTIIGPVETEYGFHLIIKKDERFTREYQLARVFVRTKEKTDIVPPTEAWKNTGLSGKQLKRAEVTEDTRTGQVQVSLNFDDEGSKLFEDITGRNIGKPVGIFLDGQPISTPNVNEAITGGSAVISGGFTYQEARLLAQRLNSGALPVPVEILSQEKVDATLGAASLEKSFKAGIVGLLLVMVFMLFYYRLPGALSVVSLSMYALLTLALFKLLGVTLTLSGIAGFILSIGMAVDANILVFERLKEEMRQGRQVRSALEESFLRAWPSIRDSHITALISCVFLVWFGSGFIQGFASVLAIGTLINLFTAITVTRTIMRLVFHWMPERGNILVLGYTPQGSISLEVKNDTK